MTPSILFRFDATATIGYGHATRCFSLFQELSARGYQVHFAVKPESQLLLTKLGVQTDYIHCVKGDIGDEIDARETAATAKRVRARWIVIDGYRFLAHYQRTLRSLSGSLLVVLDDDVIDSFNAHIILNQNLGAELRSRYEVSKETKLLLGAHYTLFRRDFYHEKPRIPRANTRNVMLMFGGADTPNATATMLSTLSNGGALDHRLVRVIIGDAYKYRDTLRSIKIPDSCQHEIVCYTPDIISQYQWSDVVISAAGSTAWELALLGIPSALISAADNQIPVAQSLAERGAAIYLGDIRDFDTQRVTERVSKLLNEYDLRMELHKRCRELFDCNGAKRVADAMENYVR